MCVFVCVYATSLPCLQKPEKALDSVYLELLTIVSSPLWALGINPAPLGKQQALNQSHLSSPRSYI